MRVKTTVVNGPKRLARRLAVLMMKMSRNTKNQRDDMNEGERYSCLRMAYFLAFDLALSSFPAN